MYTMNAIYTIADRLPSHDMTQKLKRMYFKIVWSKSDPLILPVLPFDLSPL